MIFYHFNNANVICFPPMSYVHICQKYFKLIPAALTAQSKLHIYIHEFEEKIHE